MNLSAGTVLVIDDNEAVRTAFDVLLSIHGARVLSAATPAEGVSLLGREAVDLVIQDMNFRREATSGEEGVALFHEIRNRFPDVPIILLTAWTHLETAVDLVKAGAADYLAKPWDDSRLLTSVRNLLDLRKARAEAQALRAQRTQARENVCRGKATTREATMPTARPGRRTTGLAVTFVRFFSHMTTTSLSAASAGPGTSMRDATG